MMVLTMSYCLRLQMWICIWVLIHQVMNSIQSIPINLVHLCLLDINSSPDCLGLIQIQIHFLTPIFSEGSFFSNQTLEISIEIRYETSNVIQ